MKGTVILSAAPNLASLAEALSAAKGKRRIPILAAFHPQEVVHRFIFLTPERIGAYREAACKE